MRGGQQLYGSWEDMHLDIWGPRTGKTTSRAIPAILDAPGAVLVTSNKRDVVDATRDVRAVAGPVWVFDPQGITLEEASWWWNPLSYVTDEVRAARLAEHFAAGLPADPRGRPHPLDYFTLVMLSEAPDRTLRMTALAARTNATLPRQSRVVARLEREGYIERRPCADDGRATNAVLTEAGLTKLTQAAPGRLATVRHYVIDALTPTQLQQLSGSSYLQWGRVRHADEADAVM